MQEQLLGCLQLSALAGRQTAPQLSQQQPRAQGASPGLCMPGISHGKNRGLHLLLLPAQSSTVQGASAAEVPLVLVTAL